MLTWSNWVAPKLTLSLATGPKLLNHLFKELHLVYIHFCVFLFLHLHSAGNGFKNSFLTIPANVTLAVLSCRWSILKVLDMQMSLKPTTRCESALMRSKSLSSSPARSARLKTMSPEHGDLNEHTVYDMFKNLYQNCTKRLLSFSRPTKLCSSWGNIGLLSRRASYADPEQVQHQISSEILQPNCTKLLLSCF